MSEITYKEAAARFGVSRAAIGQWVNKGILQEGKPKGRAKTVTKESLEAKLNDGNFIDGVNIARGTRLVAPEKGEMIVKNGNVEEYLATIVEQQKQILENQKTLSRELQEMKATMRALTGSQSSSPIPIKPSTIRETHSSKKPDSIQSSFKTDENLEKKAQFILEVSERAIEIYGRNKPNPFSLRNIDPTGGNITSLIKKGKRPKDRINSTCEMILEINRKVGTFDRLSLDRIEVK